jgi:hypothetical protein
MPNKYFIFTVKIAITFRNVIKSEYFFVEFKFQLNIIFIFISSVHFVL